MPLVSLYVLDGLARVKIVVATIIVVTVASNRGKCDPRQLESRLS